MFTTDVDPRTDPVLLGLGGSKWLEGRKQTLKTQDRLGRLCRNCNKRYVYSDWKLRALISLQRTAGQAHAMFSVQAHILLVRLDDLL